MKKILLTSGLLCGLAASFTGCYNDKFDKLYVTPTTTVDLCDTATNPATYSASVKTIFTSKCASTGCHNSSTRQSGYDFSLYATDSASTARITARLTTGMPPASAAQLSDCEKKQIYSWINHGSRNN